MDANFWKDYRRNTGNLTWRLATEDDYPDILRIKETTERLLHEKQKSPALFERPVLLALVAEDVEGHIVDALYVEAQVEVVKIGCTEDGLVETAGLESDLYSWLHGLGFKTATIRTRKSLKEKMRVVLEYLGFHCEDDEFSYWKRDL
jgi:hypothetical protein